jgi:hypothetical protein
MSVSSTLPGSWTMMTALPPAATTSAAVWRRASLAAAARPHTVGTGSGVGAWAVVGDYQS